MVVVAFGDGVDVLPVFNITCYVILCFYGMSLFFFSFFFLFIFTKCVQDIHNKTSDSLTPLWWCTCGSWTNSVLLWCTTTHSESKLFSLTHDIWIMLLYAWKAFLVKKMLKFDWYCAAVSADASLLQGSGFSLELVSFPGCSTPTKGASSYSLDDFPILTWFSKWSTGTASHSLFVAVHRLFIRTVVYPQISQCDPTNSE